MQPFDYFRNRREERRAIREQETPEGRAARVTADATWWMAAFTFVLMLVGIGTVLVGVGTFWILKNQLKEMHEGGIDTHALAKASGDAASAAGNQADAAQQFSDTTEDINDRMSEAVEQLKVSAENAKRSIEATQDAMRLDQRAWIVWKVIEGAPTLNQSWFINVYFTNTGKTPAKNVRVSCTAAPVSTEAEVDFGKKVSGQKPTIIAPNDASTYCSLKPLTIPTVNQYVLDTFSSREKSEFVYGHLTYDDIFGNKHWLTFCRVMEPDGKSWDSCETHNDTGDGELL